MRFIKQLICALKGHVGISFGNFIGGFGPDRMKRHWACKKCGKRWIE